MLVGTPWQSLREYCEPDYYKGDVFYESPTSLPHTVYCWKAHHRKTQKLFVFKAIHRSQIDHLDEELKLMQQFKDRDMEHPNLVKVYDVIYKDGSDWVFYQMEYCEGESLRYYLNGEPIDFSRSLTVIELMLKGLSCLYKKGLIHRDLKPDNTFFLKDGTPKIGDYGLVKSQRWLTYLSTAGTRDYQAPEMRDKANASLRAKRDHRCDIYSVGVIFCEMLTGQSPPFDDTIKKQLKSIGCSPNVPEIVMKAMVSDPDKRFQSADDFLNALAEALPF
jgi:serine/threonine-protein kinase